MADIHKVGLLVIRENSILLCRKNRTTTLLILPGGKYETGESAEACLRRELREELGDVDVDGIQFIETYVDEAAGSCRQMVQIDLYRGELIGDPTPKSEIAELVWFGEQHDRASVAPSIRNKILPDLIARRILPWR